MRFLCFFRNRYKGAQSAEALFERATNSPILKKNLTAAESEKREVF